MQRNFNRRITRSAAAATSKYDLGTAERGSHPRRRPDLQSTCREWLPVIHKPDYAGDHLGKDLLSRRDQESLKHKVMSEQPHGQLLGAALGPKSRQVEPQLGRLICGLLEHMAFQAATRRLLKSVAEA